MNSTERDFKGIWIPARIWNDVRLGALDKIIYAEIDSLSNAERGCYASNQYLAEFCNCSESKVSKSISLLRDCGYISIKSFDGRQREIVTNSEIVTNCNSASQILQGRVVKNTRQSSKKYEADSENLRQINIVDINNILYNIEYNFSSSLIESIESWIKYKKEKKQMYKEMGLKTLLSKIKRYSEKYGDRAVIEVIEKSMSNNYDGIIFDSLERGGRNVQRTGRKTDDAEPVKLKGGTCL